MAEARAKASLKAFWEKCREVFRIGHRNQNQDQDQPRPGLRILLTDGTSTTARQIAAILLKKGHKVHAICPPGKGLLRFMKRVKIHPLPPHAENRHWHIQVLALAQRLDIQVMIPTQDEVAILATRSYLYHDIGVSMTIPALTSLSLIMDKITAANTIRALTNFDQPRWRVISNNAELLSFSHDSPELFPAFVRQPLRTRGNEILVVYSQADLERLTTPWIENAFRREGPLSQLLVQGAVEGQLQNVQGIFNRGMMIKSHSWRRPDAAYRIDSKFASSRKESLPARHSFRAMLAYLGQRLCWTGPLAMELIELADTDTVLVMDVSPYLAEPMNAYLSGKDLVESILEIKTTEEHPEPNIQFNRINNRNDLG
ncbi:hypothetical protein B0T26DRAFT_26488 [Lasiosphaeria miniovina]|uniref:Uncharacterized protein n=1 Tax=Lasiosphaeria miniovina TaxID=1954250 RepID=A0AA40BFZ9_9PEZI|nr:uncharacterized protein B0T26DRAFT_26488 [Lasiosphaeria miniovina]KAK0733554.1 hypothetical protein B0T26DRAFT_26488 [Lasiosphaeria miniovina]